MDYDDAAELIRRHEGYRNRLHLDTTGHLSGGVGHCFRVGGYLPVAVVERLFHYDYGKAIAGYRTICTNYNIKVDGVRRAVLLSMIFQLGLIGTLKFSKMIAHLQKKDHDGAASEMKKSKWYKQTPDRVDELSEMMRTGNAP